MLARPPCRDLAADNAAARRVAAAYSFADPAGYLMRKTYNNGVYTDYAYDAQGRLTGLTNRTSSAILDAYQYGYDPAQMITSITRLAGAAAPATVSFGYDKTYQLTSEIGRYASNFVPFVSFVVTNLFSYDAAGNRIASVAAAATPRFYLHTPDNQLTTICWNAASVTLRGRLDNAWTADWVKVKHHMAIHWISATVRCERGQPVRWEACDVPVSVTLPASFDVEAHTPDGQTVSDTIPYTKINGSPGRITCVYDANGNRTEKWTNGVFVARYFYDTDNQLLGISFNNDQDCTDAGDYAYAYDPFGRRISATEDSVTRYFAYDGIDSIAELDANANVKKWYLRGSGLGGGIADIIAEITPTLTNYFSYNHRGDVVTLTRPDGQVTNRFEYAAFGAPVSCFHFHGSSGIRAVAFSSKEYDTRSGLSYYGFRYYDADSGRWLTKDPLNYSSMEMNFYLYALNSPLQYIDSYGLQTRYVRRDCFIFIIAAHRYDTALSYLMGRLMNDKKTNFRVGVATCMAVELNAVFASQGKSISNSPQNNEVRYFSDILADVKRMWKQADKDAQTMIQDNCCKCVIVQVQCPEQPGTLQTTLTSVSMYLGEWCGRLKTKGECFP